MNRVILYLVRRKLGVKKRECFRFANQTSKFDYYYINDKEIVRVSKCGIRPSNVSLNWLLNKECEIVKVM